MADFIVNLLLFFFQFEYLSTGLITVSRVVIFPLLCVYVLFQKKIHFPSYPLMLVCLLFLVVQALSSIGNGEYAFLFSAILQFLILIVFMDYLIKKRSLGMSSWFLLASYDITSIICYLIGYSRSEMSRFSGIYWDPNVMCFYILISISAKIYLFSRLNNVFLRASFILMILFDIYIIVQSLSRGAFLTIFLISMILVYRYSRLLLLVVSFITIPTISFLYLIYKDAQWDSSMSALDLLFFRIFSSTGDELDYAQDGTRIARAQSFYEALQSGDISIIGNATSVMPDGEYVHNGLLEFILAVGFPMGVIFIVTFVYLIFQTLLKPIYNRTFDLSILLPISFFSSSVFYSYLGYKMFWFFIAILIFYKYNPVRLRF